VESKAENLPCCVPKTPHSLRNNHRNGKMLIAKTGQESYDSGWLAQNEYASGGYRYAV
jgi:hypothetical protein